MDRVLVLDGEARAALAVVRSLGRLGLELAVASDDPLAIAQRSRYASRRLACPSPASRPAEFQDWLERAVQDWQPHMVLPLTDVSLGLALARAPALRERTVLPAVDAAAFARVSDKGALLEAAEDLGIATPATLRLPPRRERTESQRRLVRDFAYPAVLKANVTQSERDGGFVRPPVAYPESADEAQRLLDGDSGLGEPAVLLQQRIVGPGTGVFALCADGRAVAWFAHRRILEKPPSGGVSVLSEGLPLERAPLAEARKLLEHFRWQGMAMVEFKRHRDGRYYLMEINPRFWGSLQLAVDSGRDFPALLYRLFRSGDPLRGDKLERFAADVPELVPGRRLRWLLGSLDHLLIRGKRDLGATLRDALLRNALELGRGRTRLEVLRWSDPLPFLAELRAYLRDAGS